MKISSFLLLIFLAFSSLAQEESYPTGLLMPDSIQLAQIPHYEYSSALGIAEKREKLPKVYDLSEEMPPAGSQGKYQNSCVGWAVAYGVGSYLKKIQNSYSYLKSGKLDNTKVYSPAFLYNYVLQNRIPKAMSCNKGMSFIEAFSVASFLGIPTLDVMPYDETDYWGCLDKKKLAEQAVIKNASTNKISFFRGLLLKEPNEIQYNLLDKSPIIIGMTINNSFKTQGELAAETKTKFIWDPDINNSFPDYHAMICVGYDEPKKLFKVLNSWGSNWGTKGYVYIPYDKFFHLIKEAYVAFCPNQELLLGANSTPEFIQPNAENEYSGHFKEGYFYVINDLYLGLNYFDKKNNKIFIEFKDYSKNKAIQTISFSPDETKSFYFNNSKVSFTFLYSKFGGKNPFKNWIYFNIKFQENVFDSFTTEVMDKFKQGSIKNETIDQNSLICHVKENDCSGFKDGQKCDQGYHIADNAFSFDCSYNMGSFSTNGTIKRYENYSNYDQVITINNDYRLQGDVGSAGRELKAEPTYSCDLILPEIRSRPIQKWNFIFNVIKTQGYDKIKGSLSIVGNGINPIKVDFIRGDTATYYHSISLMPGNYTVSVQWGKITRGCVGTDFLGQICSNTESILTQWEFNISKSFESSQK